MRERGREEKKKKKKESKEGIRDTCNVINVKRLIAVPYFKFWRIFLASV